MAGNVAVLRVIGCVYWTPLLAWLGVHPKRGEQACDAFWLLIALAGILIHVGWKPYRDLVVKHVM